MGSFNSGYGDTNFGPSPTKAINFTNFAPTFDYTDQFLPEVLGEEFQRFGNRTISGFLNKVGGEMPFTSAEIKWAEQGRLHTLYNNVTLATGTSNVFTTRTQGGNRSASAVVNVLRPGQTVLIQDGEGTTEKGVITAIGSSTGEVTILSYENANWAISRVDDSVAANSVCKLFVYGTEFGKGQDGLSGSIDPNVDIYTVEPIIIKENFRINGSDMAQIGWVEGVTEDGTTGYLWYLKGNSETMLRFQDYMEMSLVEGIEAVSTSGAAVRTGQLTYEDGNIIDGGFAGTSGLFAQIESRGNVFGDLFLSSDSFDAAEADADIEEIILQLDKEGAISENMLWFARQESLNFDKWLATKNAINGTGASYYGAFNNSADMALSLNFSSFDWGGYAFHKTVWKYLTDPTLRGAVDDIKGLLIPAGTMSVHDENLGSNVVRPFVYAAYRTSETTNRKYKYWLTGGEAGTNDTDDLRFNYLSERALVVQGANNFMEFNAG